MLLREMTGSIHLEKEIRAPVGGTCKAFRQTQALKKWYDPRCHIDGFRAGGRLVGDNYPSAEILVVVPNHTIVHRYSDIVAGLGIWSFVEKRNGRSTLLIFDHIDACQSKEDRDSISFYWKGLVENLAAFCEGREIPFDLDAGDYKQGKAGRS